MSINFIIAQVIGTIALIVLMYSFQNNKKQRLLKLQILSSLLFALQYLFLNAYTGCLMNLMCMIRNIIFNKYEKNRVPIYWLITIVAFMIFLSVLTYKDLISLFPMIAVVVYSCAIWKDNLRIIRIIEVISCILFIVYNIHVSAIIGLISTIVEIIGAIIAIYRFDIKKKVGQ